MTAFRVYLRLHSPTGPAPAAQDPSLAGRGLAPGRGGGIPSPDQGFDLIEISLIAEF